MAVKSLSKFLRTAHISNYNRLVLASWSYQWVTPSTSANSMTVLFIRLDHLLVLDVPDLYSSIKCADTQVFSLLTPSNRSDHAVICKTDQLCHTFSVSVPDVHWSVKCYSKSIFCWPVHQIQIEVIAEVWRIKNSKRLSRNFSYFINQKFLSRAATS
jgi:hypothetical protein